MAKAARLRARSRSRSAGGWRGRLAEIVRRLAADSVEHHLWTYASAISFRALVALVPLALLGLALLSTLGLEDVWSNSVAPAIQAHVTAPVYAAINFALAIAVIVCTVGSVLAVILGPRPGGALHIVFGVGHWPSPSCS
jgi:uncharacterized BrkB/YihY/UPF0761 family membrane protein